MQIILPWPNPLLAPNRSRSAHWGKTSAIRKTAREEAYILTKQALGGQKIGTGDIALTIWFCQPDKRGRDLDGLLSSMKSAIDGIADALRVNDKKFNPISIHREYGSKPGYVTVQIDAIYYL
jgi:crossover junction endodeoxyribonuclease RusA